MSDFQECWDRIDRAEFHAKTLVEGCEALLSDKAYRVTPQLRNQRDGSLVIVPKVPVNSDFPLILGEFFYQLRAALDSAAWKAYEIRGLTDPAPDLKKLYFPIVMKKKGTFNDATIQAVKLPNKLMAWLRSIQPCCADERAKGSDEDILSNTLIAINECATSDRHRKLHLVGAYLTFSAPHVEVTPPAQIVDLRAITSGDYFKGELTIAEFTVEGFTADTQVRGEGKFGLKVSVNEIPSTEGIDLGRQLANMINNTRFVIQTFEDALT